jgi:hypothetical protein
MNSTRNNLILTDFADYCAAHPDQRFWQALRNWSGFNFVTVGDTFDENHDTFYWEGKGPNA